MATPKPEISNRTLLSCALALEGRSMNVFAQEQGISLGFLYKVLRGEKKAKPALAAAIEAAIADHR